MFQFELGTFVRDVVTKFGGIVISRCEHLSGCSTYGVQAQAKKDGTIDSAAWFDEPRLRQEGSRRVSVNQPLPATGADSVPQRTR